MGSLEVEVGGSWAGKFRSTNARSFDQGPGFCRGGEQIRRSADALASAECEREYPWRRGCFSGRNSGFVFELGDF